jgi:DNA primase catalytic core
MQVSKEGIERLKAANELAAVVAEHGIEVKRKGRQLVALCPFHSEKTPSFVLTPSKGLFRCFGCGKAGDVIGFVVHHDKLSFPEAVRKLATRAGLQMDKLMEERPRVLRAAPLDVLTPVSKAPRAPETAPPATVLPLVVDHYHRTFCERGDAQEYMKRRGLTDLDLLRALKVGYADGSLLKVIPRNGELRDQLVKLGVVTEEGRELLGGCIVVPLPDPVTGAWVNLYGRGVRTPRHCYLPGPLSGVLNFQAARSRSAIILTESVIDALSFHQAGIATAIPLYGTSGFTPDHLDLLKREQVKEVALALDNDEAGHKATEALKEKLSRLNIAVRIASFPSGIKDANELLVSAGAGADEAFGKILDDAQPRTAPPRPDPPQVPAVVEPVMAVSNSLTVTRDEGGQLTLRRGDVSYGARVYPVSLGRMRATVKVERGERFHVDTLDLYASRSRTEFGKRVAKAIGLGAETIEADLLALVVEAEKAAAEETGGLGALVRITMTDAERAEALALLRRGDLLDQVARDIDALGYVGEDTNKRLLYLVAISRKLPDPLSAVILSQSGAGKSGLTEVIERLTPPEDVVLFTRLTPQSLYYTEQGYLDQKLVIVEERYGSVDADYSIRVLQSRKKLSVAAPIKDPSTGHMRTKVFTVEARAAFIEATTASQVNHENATRCFELTMDESKEQTARIHERQRLLRTEAGLRLREEADAIVRRHWNAQRLLEPLPVVIPYADRLTFPISWMRTRRDHARFLNLIEVSAFLHQHQRERTTSGAIVATASDYTAAYELARHVLAETLSDLKKPLREAYGHIRDLCHGNGACVSRREIREALALPDSTVRHWLQDLVELEYLEAEASKGGAGKATRYRLTPRGPREDLILGLLSPEDLGKLLAKR